jgi:hypothetical protein
MEAKKWYTSKTIWANVMAVIASAVVAKTGYVIPAEYQAMMLTAMNVFLRKITKSEITW